MFGKRRAIALLAAILGTTVAGVLSNSYGQSPDPAEPGVTYGGVRDYEWVWMRLDGSRQVVLALEVPWTVSGRRCSNRKGYASVMYGGAEYGESIGIRPDGTFTKTVVDRYRDAGVRYVETQTVRGTLTPDRVTGTVAGNVRRTMPTGRVVRCTFGPLRWNAVD